jgi:hypothetical protein
MLLEIGPDLLSVYLVAKIHAEEQLLLHISVH